MTKQNNKLLKYADFLVKWIQNEVKKANFKGVIFGMSGGLDSSVVAFLAKKAFPKNSLGLLLPIGKINQDFNDAQKVAKKIKIKIKIIDLTNVFNATINKINIKNKLAIANIKPRLRMIMLYTFAQANRYLVLGTGNAAEWSLGYFTKYGDGGVDIMPIIHLNKGEIKQLAIAFDLPQVVYQKKPSAGLWEGQTDEQELGFSYDEIDKYLMNQKISNKIKKKIEKQKSVTEHKRKPIPTPKEFKKL